MNDEHVRDELMGYMNGELDPERQAAVRAHVAVCNDCREELEGLSGMWKMLGQLPEEKPSPQLRARFYDALRAYEEVAREPGLPMRQKRKGFFEYFSPKQVAIQFGVGFAILLVGFFVGYQLRDVRVDQTQIAQLRGEVGAMNRLLAVSLLQQQSASERLKGVSISNQMDDADPEITAALLQALKYDPNVNVRLAALDALGRSTSQPAVRSELLKSLPKQTSPLVQMAIIDLMVQMQEKQSVEALKQMMSSPGINGAVKRKIEQSLQQLS